MTNVKFLRKEFEKEIKLTPQVIEKISLFGTPLESLNDKEIEIEIFPNRPDLISMQGYLRGFKAFIGKSQSIEKYKLNKPLPNYKVKINPNVKPIRPFTVCAIVKGISLDSNKIKEIVELQEKLHITVGRNRKKLALGLYPLEKIKLPITYEARSPKDIKFIPLDLKKELTAPQILRIHPKGRAFAHLIKDLNKYPIFVDSNNEILSMTPIINSQKTGKVTEQTKEIFIEVSGFDLKMLNKTLNIVVTTLADMGGKIYQMNLEYKNKKFTTPNLSLEKMKLSLENTNKLLGLNLKETELSKLLEKMGLKYKNKTATIPAWRTDILHEVDLIEDIAIAYGYNNILPQIPNVSTIAEESFESKIKSKISEILIGLNLTEISTYHLIKQKESKLAKLKNLIEVENSKTEYKILRPNLLIPALRILAENKDQDYPQEIFEIGTVFSTDKNEETGIKETENLIVLSSPANFTKIKQLLNTLTSHLNLKYELEETTHSSLINGRTAKIIINEKEIGHLGEIHPETLRAWTIKMPCAILEISLDEIFNLLKI